MRGGFVVVELNLDMIMDGFIEVRWRRGVGIYTSE
jgi:hypothetical protein